MHGIYILPLRGLAAVANKKMAASYHVGNISPRINGCRVDIFHKCLTINLMINH